MPHLRFDLAAAADEPALRGFARTVEMPGAIRLVFERDPDYFDALRVEGRESQVLVCRAPGVNRIVGTGHRSIKSMFVNGEAAPVGYLGGLRLDRSVRHGRLLARGYRFLRELHNTGTARFYLTTIMEDNREARAALLAPRGGLPRYHDFGRFCCMALGLHSKRSSRGNSSLHVRNAGPGDAPAIVAFLQREGPSRQFFPKYQTDDFGVPGGLLTHLDWGDVFLAFRGNELAGMVAAWDQRAFRQWRVTGYAGWLRCLRRPANTLARMKRMPQLPKPGSPLNYFILSLVCVAGNDRTVFAALLQELIARRRGRNDFFLAGLHERDPLLPELADRPHVPLPSRLYVVAWDDDEATVRTLDRSRVPYLELGSL